QCHKPLPGLPSASMSQASTWSAVSINVTSLYLVCRQHQCHKPLPGLPSAVQQTDKAIFLKNVHEHFEPVMA
ncbi:hypothetical protein LSAT2_029260, partial [Lamellibrachia satsuma]